MLGPPGSLASFRLVKQSPEASAKGTSEQGPEMIRLQCGGQVGNVAEQPFQQVQGTAAVAQGSLGLLLLAQAVVLLGQANAAAQKRGGLHPARPAPGHPLVQALDRVRRR